MKTILFVFLFLFTSILNLEVNLTEGIYHNFTNVTAKKLSFLLKVSPGKTVNFSIIIKCNKIESPYRRLSYAECYNRKKITTAVATGPGELDYEYNKSFSYQISYNDKINYFNIFFNPLIDYTFLSIRAEVGGDTFNLTAGVPSTFYNIKSGFFNTFFVPAQFNQSVTISLILNKLDDLPFDTLNIQEKEFISSNHYGTIRHKLKPKIKEKDKQIQMSISFTTIRDPINYVAFDILPKYEIKYLKVQIDVN